MFRRMLKCTVCYSVNVLWSACVFGLKDYKIQAHILLRAMMRSTEHTSRRSLVKNIFRLYSQRVTCQTNRQSRLAYCELLLWMLARIEMGKETSEADQRPSPWIGPFRSPSLSVLNATRPNP